MKKIIISCDLCERKCDSQIPHLDLCQNCFRRVEPVINTDEVNLFK